MQAGTGCKVTMQAKIPASVGQGKRDGKKKIQTPTSEQNIYHLALYHIYALCRHNLFFFIHCTEAQYHDAVRDGHAGYF